MGNMNIQRVLSGTDGAPRPSARLSPGGYLMLYSQYILLALLVLGALALRLVFGAP